MRLTKDPTMAEPIMNRDFVCCYVLMRTDLKSLCAGKAMAQAHHAASKLHKDATGGSWVKRDQDNYERWIKEADGFGTTIVLSVNEQEMRRSLINARDYGYAHSAVNDPEYHLWDGATLHLFPLDTCAYIFGEKRFIESTVIGLDLLRRPSLWQPVK